MGLGAIPGLRVVTADARPFLRRTHERYDLIVVDAYRQPYVPFYLATQEFFRLARAHLRPGGILALNVATVRGDHRLARGIAGTLRTVFPQVLAWQALELNQLVLGVERPLSPRALRAAVAADAGAHPPAHAPARRAARARRPPARARGPTTAPRSSG